MTLTVLQCADWIRQTLGGPSASVAHTKQLVNMAGKHFVSMTRWRYLEGVTASLNTVASQDYLDLPTDYSQPISVQPTSSVSSVVWVERSVLNEYRANQLPIDGCTYIAVETVDSVPRLAIYPTPASTTSGAYQLVYRAGWTNVVSDNDEVAIPEWGETLFEMILRAFARGVNREETGSVSARLAEIQGEPGRPGPLFRAALKEDRTKQTDHGPIRGAIAARRRQYWPPTGYSTGP